MIIENFPKDIIAAFTKRLNDFKILVETFGGKFLFALQPHIYSKKSQSLYEIEKLLSLKSLPWWPIMERMNLLYSLLQRSIIKNYDHNLIDFHNLFIKFDHSQTVFEDNSHCNKKGDNFIAMEYFKFIKTNKLI